MKGGNLDSILQISDCQLQRQREVTSSGTKSSGVNFRRGKHKTNVKQSFLTARSIKLWEHLSEGKAESLISWDPLN